MNSRIEDIKKGFKHLGPKPQLEESMKFCSEYMLGDAIEKKRLEEIVTKCIKTVRGTGEIADDAFNKLVLFFVIFHVLTNSRKHLKI